MAGQCLSFFLDSLFVLDAAAHRSHNVRGLEGGMEVSVGPLEFLFGACASFLHFLHHAARKGDKGDSAADFAGVSAHARSRPSHRLGGIQRMSDRAGPFSRREDVG